MLKLGYMLELDVTLLILPFVFSAPKLDERNTCRMRLRATRVPEVSDRTNPNRYNIVTLMPMEIDGNGFGL